MQISQVLELLWARAQFLSAARVAKICLYLSEFFRHVFIWKPIIVLQAFCVAFLSFFIMTFLRFSNGSFFSSDFYKSFKASLFLGIFLKQFSWNISSCSRISSKLRASPRQRGRRPIGHTVQREQTERHLCITNVLWRKNTEHQYIIDALAQSINSDYIAI